MQVIPVVDGRRGFGQTARRDAWWKTPALIFVALSLFVVYATWAAFQNAHYAFGPYLSPFYSPELFGASSHAWLGPKPEWWPGLLPFSPALIILPFPGLFRLTCYYYRGAYYKSFWADPPACAVGEPRKHYRGEQSFPLILQNIHRYFMWVALVFIALLAWDVWKALWFADPATGQVHFGVGVGTLVLGTNVVLLACYTWGCHVLRHVVGGRLNEMSKSPVCEYAYSCVSGLNGRHQLFAWCSLVSVMSADLYVRLCSMGMIHDLRLF
ncbi:MAG: succinate dehydrogenase [Acidobacteria bacterium]|jgi:hypothetical protein|nr:succinate dehydrogenase [Acidobacteriota bacterium]